MFKSAFKTLLHQLNVPYKISTDGHTLVLGIPTNFHNVDPSLWSFLGLTKFKLIDFSRETCLLDGPTTFLFYLGHDPKYLPVIEAFVASEAPANATHISLGNSSYSFGGRGPIDYGKHLDTLSKAHYPKLTSASLGTWELYCNSHEAFGKLGNITSLLNTMPIVEKLYLFGHFSVDELSLPHLTSLEVWVEDFGWNEQAISQTTLNNLLQSAQPEKLTLILGFEDEPEKSIQYRFEPNLFDNPNLKNLEISAYIEASLQDEIHRRYPNLKSCYIENLALEQGC